MNDKNPGNVKQNYPHKINAAGFKDGQPDKIKELGGVKGPEPTRYGDWEKNGRCSDF